MSTTFQPADTSTLTKFFGKYRGTVTDNQDRPLGAICVHLYRASDRSLDQRVFARAKRSKLW